jgi:hypothetical protein
MILLSLKSKAPPLEEGCIIRIFESCLLKYTGVANCVAVLSVYRVVAF